MSKKSKRIRQSPIKADPVTGQISKETKFVFSSTGLWTYDTENEKSIFEGLEKDSDRAAGIIAASMIDVRLDSALRHRLRRDVDVEELTFSSRGPLSTFSARIDMAYLMGLISKTARKDIHTIRDIRNDFAHDLSIRDFESNSIKDRTNNLQLIETHVVNRDQNDPKALLLALKPGSIPRMGVDDFPVKKIKPRDRYLISCSLFIVALSNAELYPDDEMI